MTKMAKKQTKELKLEDILFNCRDHLRGRAPMTDKRDLLLTLVFLKFIGDRFIERKQEILNTEEDKKFAEEIAVKNESFYKSKGIFFLDDDTLWEKLIQSDPKDMAIKFDNAIAELEKRESKLKNALPQQIFTKTQLEPSVLKAVVDDINKIDNSKFNEKISNISR